jgi:DNA-binding IclR family transcriptional regulator
MTAPSHADPAWARAAGWLEGQAGWATVAVIADGAGASTTTVRRVLRSLDEAGRLETDESWPRGYRVAGGWPR